MGVTTDHIRVRETTALYWDEFPYKVVVRLTGNPMTAVARLSRHLPEGDDWRFRCSPSQNSFFFKNAEDARRFVEANSKHVLEVWEPPANLGQYLGLNEDGHRTVLRDTLWYDQYRYCVVFRRSMSKAENDDLDDWAQEFFLGSDEQRAYFSYSLERRVYLNDPDDVFMVTLAHKPIILRIERAILKKEIRDERRFGDATDRDEGHQERD